MAYSSRRPIAKRTGYRVSRRGSGTEMTRQRGRRPQRTACAAARASALGVALIAVACNGMLGFQDGRLEPAHCNSNDDCAPGRSCYAGKCRSGCGSESDCPKSSTCLPTTLGGACVIDADLRCDRVGASCPSGTHCVYGLVCLADCNSGNCFAGQACRDGVCVDLGDDGSDAGADGCAVANACGGCTPLASTPGNGCGPVWKVCLRPDDGVAIL